MGLCGALTGYWVSFGAFRQSRRYWQAWALGWIGLIYGILIARFGMPAFIVTLAGLSIWRGAAHLSTGAKATPQLPDAFNWFGRLNPLEALRAAYQSGKLPAWLNGLNAFLDNNWVGYFRTFQMSMVIFIVFFVILAVIVSNTIYGRYVFAIGSSEAGARQAGINTVRYKLLTYVFCSLSAALGALLILGRAPYAKSTSTAAGSSMRSRPSSSAVRRSGGRGTIWGTFLGVIFKLINNGLTLAQLNTFWQMIVTGMIILIAVGLDIVRQSRSPGKRAGFWRPLARQWPFFTLLTPASLWLRAAVALHEHYSVTGLREGGVQLASSQSERLLSPVESMTWRPRWQAVSGPLSHARLHCPIGRVHRNEEPPGQPRRLCRVRRERLRHGSGRLFRRSALPRPRRCGRRGQFAVLNVFERG